MSKAKVINISNYLITQPSQAKIEAFKKFEIEENFQIKKDILELVQSSEIMLSVMKSKLTNYELKKIRDSLEDNICNSLGRVMF